jgi:hypothetical protein
MVSHQPATAIFGRAVNRQPSTAPAQRLDLFSLRIIQYVPPDRAQTQHVIFSTSTMKPNQDHNGGFVVGFFLSIFHPRFALSAENNLHDL